MYFINTLLTRVDLVWDSSHTHQWWNCKDNNKQIKSDYSFFFFKTTIQCKLFHIRWNIEFTNSFPYVVNITVPCRMSRMCVAVQEVTSATICVNRISGRQGVTWPLRKDETRCLLQTPTNKSVRLEDKKWTFWDHRGRLWYTRINVSTFETISHETKIYNFLTSRLNQVFSNKISSRFKGAPGMRPSPRSKFFYFRAVFGKNFEKWVYLFLPCKLTFSPFTNKCTRG